MKKIINALQKLALPLPVLYLIATLLLTSLFSFLINVSIKIDISRTKCQLARLKNIPSQAQGLQQISEIEDISKKELNILNTLKAITASIPKEVLLDSLILAPDKIILKASVFSDYEQAVRVTQEFRKNLESIVYLDNIKISPLELETMSPFFTGELGKNQEIKLTKPKKREFTVFAHLLN